MSIIRDSEEKLSDLQVNRVVTHSILERLELHGQTYTDKELRDIGDHIMSVLIHFLEIMPLIDRVTEEKMNVLLNFELKKNKHILKKMRSLTQSLNVLKQDSTLANLFKSVLRKIRIEENKFLSLNPMLLGNHLLALINDILIKDTLMHTTEITALLTEFSEFSPLIGGSLGNSLQIELIKVLVNQLLNQPFNLNKLISLSAHVGIMASHPDALSLSNPERLSNQLISTQKEIVQAFNAGNKENAAQGMLMFSQLASQVPEPLRNTLHTSLASVIASCIQGNVSSTTKLVELSLDVAKLSPIHAHRVARFKLFTYADVGELPVIENNHFVVNSL